MAAIGKPKRTRGPVNTFGKTALPPIACGGGQAGFPTARLFWRPRDVALVATFATAALKGGATLLEVSQPLGLSHSTRPVFTSRQRQTSFALRACLPAQIAQPSSVVGNSEDVHRPPTGFDGIPSSTGFRGGPYRPTSYGGRPCRTCTGVGVAANVALESFATTIGAIASRAEALNLYVSWARSPLIVGPALPCRLLCRGQCRQELPHPPTSSREADGHKVAHRQAPKAAPPPSAEAGEHRKSRQC
jgi:hypothetical protein